VFREDVGQGGGIFLQLPLDTGKLASMNEAPKARRGGRRPSYVFNREAALMARLRKGWTERDVIAECDRLGHPRIGNLHKYETGALTPSPPVLRVLAAVLSVPVEDLASPRTEGTAA
jgi:hypothetical protein